MGWVGFREIRSEGGYLGTVDPNPFLKSFLIRKKLIALVGVSCFFWGDTVSFSRVFGSYLKGVIF